MKGELTELLDTLTDLQQSYPLSEPGAAPTTPLHHKLKSLLPLLLSAYGATLSGPDQSLLRVLLHINDVVFHSPEHQQAQQQKQAAAASTSAASSATPSAAASIDISLAAGAVRVAGAGGHADGDAGEIIGDAKDDINAEEQDGKIDGPITAMLHGPLAMAGYILFFTDGPYSVNRPCTHKRMLIIMEQERLDSTLGLLACYSWT